MTDVFFKFPSTPHLALMRGVDVRGDKVLSEQEQIKFLTHEIVVEEKIDGANLGISFDNEGNIKVQNRGSFLGLPGDGQWKKLHEWLEPRLNELFEVLGNRFILFGEWCYAQHSVYYEELPDWFLGFDVFDKNIQRFFSCPRRDIALDSMGICRVPSLAKGLFSLDGLEMLFQQSRVGTRPCEGLYLRVDGVKWLKMRAKLVRPEFVQSIGKHWSRSQMKINRIHYSSESL